MVVRLQKLLIILLFVVAAAFWGYFIYLDSFYYENAPREELTAQGRVHPQFVHHGAKVFLTEQELFNFEVLFPSISIGSVLIAGLLDLRWKHFIFTKDFKGADPFSWLRRKKRN
jgi:hypothetical protein